MCKRGRAELGSRRHHLQGAVIWTGGDWVVGEHSIATAERLKALVLVALSLFWSSLLIVTSVLKIGVSILWTDYSCTRCFIKCSEQLSYAVELEFIIFLYFGGKYFRRSIFLCCFNVSVYLLIWNWMLRGSIFLGMSFFNFSFFF